MNPGSLNILVVEDEFIVALELKTALEAMGYTVCGMVNSGADAIACAEQDRPDCVLMDVSLKGEMDGIEAARRIHDRFGIRTAFLSGYPAEKVMDRAGEVDPLGCLVKPFEYDQLEAMLQRFFDSVAGGVN